MEDMNFVLTHLVDKVKLSPKLLKHDFEKNILTVLKEINEGKCSKHGYIKNNSIKITRINLGKIEMHTFHGYTVFDVFFEASVCNPVIGNIVQCVVRNMNNFGILCSSGSKEENEFILDVIIPKHTSNIISDVVLSNIKVGDNVKVEILGKKYQLNSKTISAIGKIITQTETNTLSVEKSTNLNIDIQDHDSEDEMLDDNNTEYDEDDDEDEYKDDTNDDLDPITQPDESDYNNDNNEENDEEVLSNSDTNESDTSDDEVY